MGGKSLVLEMKKHILLDIDGVFNVDYIGDDIEVVNHLYGRWLCKSSTLKTLVKIFYQKYDDYNFVWISSWMNESNYLNQYINIPDFEIIKYVTTINGWVKANSILQFIQDHKNDQIIIIDDEIPDYFIKQLLEYEFVSVIKPVYRDGISAKQLLSL